MANKKDDSSPLNKFTEINQYNMSDEFLEVGDITRDLTEWNGTDDQALDKVFPKVYKNLQNLARKARRSTGLTDSNETFNTLGLVNELYLKFRKNKSLVFDNRRKFYAYCLLVMTNLLKDYYWKKHSKRNEIRLLDKIDSENENQISNLMDLSALSDYENKYKTIEIGIFVNSILEQLNDDFPIEVEVLVLKFWLGFTDNEIAKELDMTKQDVQDYLMNGLALIREMIDSEIEPLITAAMDITDTASRSDFLQKHCGDDKDLLIDLEIILKGKMTKKGFH